MSRNKWYRFMKKTMTVVIVSVLLLQNPVETGMVYAAYDSMGMVNENNRVEQDSSADEKDKMKSVESEENEQPEQDKNVDSSELEETNEDFAESQESIEGEISESSLLESETEEEKETAPAEEAVEATEQESVEIIGIDVDIESEESMECGETDSKSDDMSETQEKMQLELLTAAETVEEFEIVDGVLKSYRGNGRSVILPEAVKKIDPSVFVGNTKIVSIDMSHTLISRIENESFQNCTNLAVVVWNQKLKYIGKQAFKGCSSLQKLECPLTLEDIDTEAFEGCSELNTVILNEGLKTIGPGAFESAGIGKNGGTQTIIIPASTMSILKSAFANCAYLEKVYFTSGNVAGFKMEQGCFAGCGRLKEVYLSEKVTSIPEQAFSNNPILEKIYIPKSVTAIKDNAMLGCPKLIIYGMLGSEAEKFANKKNNVKKDTIPFVSIAESMGLLLLPQNVSFEAKNGDVGSLLGQSYQMQASLIPNGSAEFTFTSSNESVVTVDAKGLVKPVGFGTATITASYGNYSDTSTVNVYPIAYATIFSAKFTPEIPERGLQFHLDTTLSIYSNLDPNQPIPLDCFELYTEDEDMAVVDDAGKITSTYTEIGTAEVNIIAKLKNDPAEREVEIPIKVVDRQAEQVALFVDEGQIMPSECKIDASNHNSVIKVILDQGEHPEGYSFDVHSICYTTKDGKEEKFAKRMKWSCSDTQMAGIELSPGGDIAIVTVKPGVSGSFLLTATANEIDPKTQVLLVEIRNYAPELSETTITLNQKLMTTQSVKVRSVDGNLIRFGTYYPMEVEMSQFQATFEADPLNTQGSITQAGRIQFGIRKGVSVKKGTYKTTVKVCTELRDYKLPITIVVTDAAPTIRFVEKSKFMTFYKDTTADYLVQCSNAKIENILLQDDNKDVKIEYDADTGHMLVAYADAYLQNPSKNLNRKCTFAVQFEGSDVLLTKNLTLTVSQAKPVLKANRNTTYIYKDGTNSGTYGIYNQTEKKWVDESTTSASGINPNIIRMETANDVDVVYDAAARKFNVRKECIENQLFTGKKKTITVKMVVKDSNWMSEVTVNHKIAFKKEATKPDGSNCSVTLSQRSVTLNQSVSGDYVEIPVKISELGYYMQADGIRPETSYMDKDKFVMRYHDGMLTISLGVTATEGTYQVPLEYRLYSELEKDTLTPVNKKRSTATITVKIIRKSPSVIATTSGKLDAIQREAGVKIKINGIKNMNYHVEDLQDVKLYGKNKSMFAVSPIQKDAKGNAYVILTTAKIKDYSGIIRDVELDTTKTYSVKLELSLQPKDNTIEPIAVYSKDISIKPTQSRFVCKLKGDTSFSRTSSVNKGNLEIMISSPSGATISNTSVSVVSNQISENLSLEMKNAWITTDGKKITIPYTLTAKSDLKAGKTYQVKLNIVPDGKATNIKPTQMIVKFKVTK